MRRQQFAARILHLTLKLRLPCRFRAAPGAGRLDKFLSRLLAPRLGVDLLYEPLSYSIVNRHPVESGVLRIILFRIGDQLRKRCILRAVNPVCRNHLQLIAPHDARIRHVDEAPGVEM